MAIVSHDPRSLGTLRAAQAWKERCLLADSSLFSGETLWTAENFQRLRDAFIGNPIEGSQPFYDKLAAQLGGQPAEIQKLAAECLWTLLVFVHEDAFRASMRRMRIEAVWALSSDTLPPNDFVSAEAMAGIGWPGTAFLTYIPNEFGFVLETFLQWKLLSSEAQRELASDPWKFCTWLTAQKEGERRIFRQMLLYLLFPDSFERVCSRKQRRKIYEVFSDRYSSSGKFDTPPGSLCELDRALLEVRKLAEEEFKSADLDFYHAPLESIWNSRPGTPPETSNQSSDRRFWIEKTNVSGRPDRLSGEHALGAALWSPQRSTAQQNIYASMTRVAVGDVVFHLTDNRGFTGVSVVASTVDDSFVGLEGTDWAGQPGYRIQLTDFQELNPILDRDSFLKTEPFAGLLRTLARPGAGVFFNKNLELNQGAYLTAAPEGLMSVLNAAYIELAGEPLPFCEGLPSPELALEASAPDLTDLFLDEEEVERIFSLWTAKKNIILQGPPGVGKSFAAQKLAYAFMGAVDEDRLQFVQFHQSYAYEDFVEGFRPSEDGFVLRRGKFVQFCERAMADPKQPYVFVIDEINRGNLSKILGELMLLIEPDKRDRSWSVELAYGRDSFYVPPNLYLLGLMNTADRSLAVVDYALRRRFAFVDLEPKLRSPKLRTRLSEKGVPENTFDLMMGRVEALNAVIIQDRTNLGPGFAIGHSFFCAGPATDEDSTAWWNRVVDTEIAPLLREYWFDSLETADHWQSQLLAPL